ncbi:transcriptional regulator GntR family domain /aspartate aminotransferase [Vibrio maritimus]|uniref:Transcriptional regulator GntR family domain /aspartate aminotransferase n=1 Tax=Vibrio maritimus TaxID=990268 RepID=A0A090TG54_9VIBR|nr:transcriptional regulator GntR family domain /aspartate aminotransferase [Vibrio maritimus]
MTIETITVFKQDPAPIYKQIADQIATMIEDGDLKANSKLPTHRWLADKLGVTVGTITRAYAEVERRGLVEAKVGAGTMSPIPINQAGCLNKARWHKAK